MTRKQFVDYFLIHGEQENNRITIKLNDIFRLSDKIFGKLKTKSNPKIIQAEEIFKSLKK